MSHIISSQNLQTCQKYDFKVQPEGLSFQIVDIQRHLLRNRQFITTIDLRPTGQTRHQFMNPAAGAQLNQVMLIEQGWPGTDKTHVALDDAPQLRQLIQTALAQETANGREINIRVHQ